MATSAANNQPTDTGRRAGTRILASVAVLALAGGMFTIASLALFTDSESVAGNTIGTGTIDLTASPASAVLTASNMAPGDQVTAPVTVTNDGSLEFRYAISSVTTENALAADLVLTVKRDVTTCNDANWATDGTDLYSGVLGTTGGTAVIGSSAQGNNNGDRVLAAAADETLCFNVTLPLSTGNSAEGLSTTATFTFDGEQTANNP